VDAGEVSLELAAQLNPLLLMDLGNGDQCFDLMVVAATDSAMVAVTLASVSRLA